MCGRYVLSQRPSVVRQRLEEQHMPTDEAPPDDDERVRQSFNFAPGYHGLIYRADTSDSGAGEKDNDGEPSPKKVKLSSPGKQVDGRATKETKYKLQAARWGLIPFWTKRPPDYASQMRTINCRDDSLIEDRGMWNTMKKRKRCIVLAEGFYEWLKKNDGKEKIPHYTTRKDGQLMCFAGLWDMVKYEDSDEKLYTYTIITTDSNKQLRFLHDRMPVIFEAGSKEMQAWVDPDNSGWSPELQKTLKPYEGELDCYPVDKAVGKVGNNSPNFVIPINSKENKNNIANFFGKQQEKAIKKEEGEDRETTKKVEDGESNAPLPKPKGEPEAKLEDAIKKEEEDLPDKDIVEAVKQQNEEKIKAEVAEIEDAELQQALKASLKETQPSPTKPSPVKSPVATPSKDSSKFRSSTTNRNTPKTPAKSNDNAKITNFFSGKT